MDGDPETQKKVKLIEAILNEAKKWKMESTMKRN
jgi:hypothetical protein